MKKKRILSTLLVGVMVGAMVLGGCGKKSASTETSGTKSSDAKYRIGFANASVSNSWRVMMRDMLMDEAKKMDVEIVETDAHDDANTQNSNIEAMLQKDLDAILITPCVEDAVNPGIEAAYACSFVPGARWQITRSGFNTLKNER